MECTIGTYVQVPLGAVHVEKNRGQLRYIPTFDQSNTVRDPCSYLFKAGRIDPLVSTMGKGAERQRPQIGLDRIRNLHNIL